MVCTSAVCFMGSNFVTCHEIIARSDTLRMNHQQQFGLAAVVRSAAHRGRQEAETGLAGGFFDLVEAAQHHQFVRLDGNGGLQFAPPVDNENIGSEFFFFFFCLISGLHLADGFRRFFCLF